MSFTTAASAPAKTRQGWSLFLLAFAHLILAIDFTIVYVALPELGSQLGFSAHTLQWVIHGYTVAFGGFLLLGGRASDLLGRRRVFMAALVLFGFASLLGGFATGPVLMVLARALQGIAAAFIFPSTLALINALFDEGPARIKALSVWSLFGSSGLALGSLLGGVLVGTFGWTSVFLVNVPLAALTALGAYLTMPVDIPQTVKRSFDIAGAICATVAGSLLVLALVEGPSMGWSSTWVLGGFAGAALAFAIFLAVEMYSRDPLLPMHLLRSRNLRIAMALTAIFMGTFMALPYFETLLFQHVFKFSPLQTGLAFLAPCLAQAFGTQVGSRITHRLGVRNTIVAGFATGALGTALLGFGMGGELGYAALLPGLILGCIGQGIAWGPIWMAVASGVDTREQGIAAAIASTTFQIGGALGLALLVCIAATASGTSDDGSDALRQGAQLATFGACAGIILAAVLAGFLKTANSQSTVADGSVA